MMGQFAYLCKKLGHCTCGLPNGHAGWLTCYDRWARRTP